MASPTPVLKTGDHHHDGRRGSVGAELIDSNGPQSPRDSPRNRWKHIAVIAACCVVVFPLFWVMAILGPSKSGVDCDEQSSIRRPHRETLTPTFLFTLITSLVAVFLLVFTEFIMCRKCKDAPHRMKFTLCKRWNCPAWLYFAARNLVAYAFGVHVTSGSVFLIRMMVAIPRPDWWSVCQPTFNTPDGLCPNHTYTTDYECANKNEKQIWDASRSFPSGHVAFIMFNAVFLMLYLEGRCRGPKICHDSVRYFLRTIEFWLFVAVFFTSAERVQANSHHPSDVYSGLLFGIAGAIFASRLLIFGGRKFSADGQGGLGNAGRNATELERRDVEVGRNNH